MSDGNPNFQHVAALLALDIDLAWDIAEEHQDDAKVLFGQFKLLKEFRDKAVSGDPKDIEETRRRFETSCMLFSLPVAGDRDG